VIYPYPENWRLLQLAPPSLKPDPSGNPHPSASTLASFLAASPLWPPSGLGLSVAAGVPVTTKLPGRRLLGLLRLPRRLALPSPSGLPRLLWSPSPPELPGQLGPPPELPAAHRRATAQTVPEWNLRPEPGLLHVERRAVGLSATLRLSGCRRAAPSRWRTASWLRTWLGAPKRRSCRSCWGRTSGIRATRSRGVRLLPPLHVLLVAHLLEVGMLFLSLLILVFLLLFILLSLLRFLRPLLAFRVGAAVGALVLPLPPPVPLPVAAPE